MKFKRFVNFIINKKHCISLDSQHIRLRCKCHFFNFSVFECYSYYNRPSIIHSSDLDLQDLKKELTSFDNNSTKPLKKQKQALKVSCQYVFQCVQKNLVSTDRNVFAATDWQVIMGCSGELVYSQEEEEVETMLLKVAFHRQVVVCLSSAFGHSRFYCDLTWR